MILEGAGIFGFVVGDSRTDHDVAGAGGDDTIDLGTDGGFGAVGDHVPNFGQSVGSGRDRITGGAADEFVLAGDSVTSTATGATAADDVVNGRGGADLIFGDNVDSQLAATIGTVGGADTLGGGDGDDRLRGAPAPTASTAAPAPTTATARRARTSRPPARSDSRMGEAEARSPSGNRRVTEPQRMPRPGCSRCPGRSRSARPPSSGAPPGPRNHG